MNQQIEVLLGGIQLWQSDPAKVRAFSIDTAARRRLPPPEPTWMLLGLMHYRARKRWAWRTLKRRISADMLQGSGHLVTLPEVLDSCCKGVVPGLPEWGFELDGNASFVFNRVTGERLHVDACNGPDVMATLYFEEYIEKHRRPGPAEQRLVELNPNGKGLLTALHCLRREGLFHVIDEADFGEFDFELCRVVDKFVEPVREFLRAWRDPHNRLLLARVIGDWAVVGELAKEQGDAGLAARAAHLSAQSRRRWLNMTHVLADEGLPDALYALANAGAEDLPEYLEAALKDPDLADVAIEVAGDDPRWRPQVYDLFRRSVKRGRQLKSVAAEYLGKLGHPARELIDGLLKEPADISAAILVALDHEPEQLRPILSRGLRSHLAGERLIAAAVLALLDCDWSRGELLDLLRQSDDQDGTVECRAALGESTSAEARQAVDQWEARHLEEDEPSEVSERLLYRMDGGCDRVLRDEMLKLSERVMRVRATLTKPT